MSKELNIIGIAVQSIKNDDLDTLDKALRVMPIEQINDPSESLLASLLGVAAGYNRPEAAKYILERWKVTYPDNDKISMITRLFTFITVNIPTLSFITSIYNDFTFVELIDELIGFDSSPNVAIACGRADEVFNRFSVNSKDQVIALQFYDTYKMLREQAKEIENFVVEEYLIDKIAETAPFKEQPSYVKNYLKDFYDRYRDKLPIEKELYEIADTESKKELEGKEIALPDDDETVNILTEGLKDLGISFVEVETAKSLIRQEIQDVNRKRDLLLPILKERKEQNLESDRLLFWTFGPSNPLLNQNLNLNTPSAKYGGGRMFLFDLFDYDEENDYISDWFTGSCEYCLLRIRNRWDAVRKPMALGGWKGCYCSFDCIRKDHEELEIREDRPDILTSRLIDAIENKINDIGIQDRII